MSFRSRVAAIRAYRPNDAQKKFMAILGVGTLAGLLFGSGYLLDKNKNTIERLQKEKNIKNKSEGSMNDQLSGITYYSAVLVVVYGLVSLFTSTPGLQELIPYMITLVAALLFAMIGLIGYILIKNQQDINEMDDDNSAFTNWALGSFYMSIAIGGIILTIYRQYFTKKNIVPPVTPV